MNPTRRNVLQALLFKGLGSLLPPTGAGMPTGTVKRVRSTVFIVSDGISHGELPLAGALSQQTLRRTI